MNARFSLLISILLATTVLAEVTRPDPKRFEEEIATFEAEDRRASPAKNGILFVGSSSIRMWDTAKSFPKNAVLNRGFGGSWIQDSTHYFDRVIKPYAPRMVVFYAGDNDLGSGLSAQAALADFQKLAGLLRQELPKAQLLYISIKPSIQRWKLWPEMRQANELIRTFSEGQLGLHFVDIAPVTLGADGAPKKAFFLEDGLHLSAEGYAAWTLVVLAKIEAILAGHD